MCASFRPSVSCYGSTVNFQYDLKKVRNVKVMLRVIGFQMQTSGYKIMLKGINKILKLTFWTPLRKVMQEALISLFARQDNNTKHASKHAVCHMASTSNFLKSKLYFNDLMQDNWCKKAF